MRVTRGADYDVTSYPARLVLAGDGGGLLEAWEAGLRPDGTGNCAPIFASDVFASPAVIPAAAYGVLGIEGEVGFRMGRDLPRRACLLR
jgi:2-keto-4-pentenoate hydratase